MELREIFLKSDPNLVIFVLTVLFAFISWTIKGLIEKPLANSRETFNKFNEKRIEIMSEVKTRLQFISFFPDVVESKEFKLQLQGILLKDGRTGYLDKELLVSVIKISITPETEEDFLLETIKKIDEDLYKQISKIQDEILFYRKFSNYSPFKRFIGFTILAIQYIVSFLFVLSILLVATNGILTVNWYWKIGIILGMTSTVYVINKWMRH